MQLDQGRETNFVSINGHVVATGFEPLDDSVLRQRAHAELLRQAAIAAGLLDASDPLTSDGVQTEAASTAIEALLDRVLDVPEPSEQACRRYYEANPQAYTSGERVHVRHILFAVTPGVDLHALRKRAENALLEVRCHNDQRTVDAFDATARKLSNCPSGTDGGRLGWLTASDCAPEFAKVVFGTKEVGVLPRLVHSRFGLHVVDVLAREVGLLQTFESVQGAVRMTLKQHAFVNALRQYLNRLASEAAIVGIHLDCAQPPLVQ